VSISSTRAVVVPDWLMQTSSYNREIWSGVSQLSESLRDEQKYREQHKIGELIAKIIFEKVLLTELRG
jgi:hypothetical protein